MSGMRHPTISAWQREEDGSYAAEINGWSLRVVWHRESREGRGYSWSAERDGEKWRSDEIFEEIEVAMGAAEERVGGPDPAETGAGDAEPGAEPGAETAAAGGGHH